MIVNVFNFNFDLERIPELRELVRYEPVSVLCNRHTDINVDYYTYTSLVQLEHDIIILASELTGEDKDNYLKKDILKQKINNYNNLIHNFFITTFKELVLSDE